MNLNVAYWAIFVRFQVTNKTTLANCEHNHKKMVEVDLNAYSAIFPRFFAASSQQNTGMQSKSSIDLLQKVSSMEAVDMSFILAIN